MLSLSFPISSTHLIINDIHLNPTNQTLPILATARSKYATIIHRGTRSLGYGFVAFSTESDAQKAVEVCDKKQMDGREINVEVAKPKDGSGGEGKGRRGGRGGNAGERGRGRGGRGRGRGARVSEASFISERAESFD